MNEEDIRKQISSNDPEILTQVLSFVTEKLELERSRGKRAEDRAAAMFAVSGILTGFIVHFSQYLILPGKAGWLILLSLYLGSIGFLIKSSFYSILALWVMKGYEVTPQLVFDIQLSSKVEAIREELIWRIWEYYQLLPLGSLRLFRANRAQRNILASIISFALLGLAWFIFERLGARVPLLVEILCAAYTGVLVLLMDRAFERLGKLWRFQ